MKVIELLEEFKAYQSATGRMPSGVALGGEAIAALQDDLLCDGDAGIASLSSHVLGVSSAPNTPLIEGDVYCMTIVGVPVFQRRGMTGIEMWRGES